MKQTEWWYTHFPIPVRNVKRIALVVQLLMFIPVQFFANALTKKEKIMASVMVRYMVNDLDPAVRFYTKYLGFQVKQEVKPNFALVSKGNLDLVLSTPFGPGGAAKPMLDGRKAMPGGWNRFVMNVHDLAAEVDRLRTFHLHFRNDIATGPGGSEILLDDPSGNPIELFQPAAVSALDDEAAIRALEDRFAAAFNAGDINAMMKNYIPDKSLVVFDVVPPRQHLGADEYRNAWVGFFKHFKGTPKIGISDLHITVDGNVGFSHSIQHVTGTDIQGNSIDRTVRVTDGYRKIGGNWLIVLEHVSVPIDLKTNKPDINSKP
jgi:uncharacterized protein (TIGR02246 family)